MTLGRWKSRVSALAARPLERVAQGVANQSELINRKFEALIKGSENQSDLLNRKLSAVIEGLDNQSKLLDGRFARLIAGVDNLSRAFNVKGERPSHSGIPAEPEQCDARPIARAADQSAPLPVRGEEAPAAPSSPRFKAMNDLQAYGDIFARITPWSGEVPKGYLVDFLGTLTAADFRVMFGVNPDTAGGKKLVTRAPSIGDGEGWFEAVNWVVSAQEARGRYVMVTLGACYGAQAVGSYRALQQLNPLPFKLVAVEPDPENMAWTRRHFRDNGIDPDLQWFVQSALSDTNAPVFFPVGSPGTGAQNCVATNERAAREAYVSDLIARGAKDALRNLLLHNSTGITKSLVPGSDFLAEVKLLSALTLGDILGPFDFVDYLESDIQQSEILVFPPFMDLLKKKVRRVHIGTHGGDVHRSLHERFERDGWDIVFSYAPNAQHSSALGSFKTNDGVLTVRNPLL